MKRISILILASVILAMFSACQGSAPEIVPEYERIVSVSDLDGFTARWGWSGIAGDTILGFIPGTAHADMIVKRLSDVEKGLNCKIEMEYSEDALTTLRTAVMSGSPYLDLIEGNGYSLVEDVRSGYLTGLSEYIDVNDYEKWGTPNMLQSMAWVNDLYGVVPYAWPDLVYTMSGHLIAVNEHYIERLAETDPREYLENGTWNWDLFEDCLRAYTYFDGTQTIYGMQCHDAYFAMNMLLSNGVPLSTVENGEVVCGAYTAAGIEAMERARKIYMESHVDCFHPSQAAGDPSLFCNGESVTYVAWSYELFSNTNSIMYKMDNVGILPFPQGPHATPGKYLSYHEGLQYATAIPFNAKDPEASAAVLSAMYEPFDEYKTKDDILNYMTAQIFYDRRDAQVLENIIRNTEYGFFREQARAVIQNACEVTTPISTLLESYANSYEQIVNNYMKPQYQGMIAVYGE